MIEQERISYLNNHPLLIEKPFVLYWMQASQRVQENAALAYAIEQANSLKKPLLVLFGLTGDFPQASERHYRFMLEGLQDVSTTLYERNIQFIVTPKGPVEGVIELADKAAVVVADFAYGRVERIWRKQVASRVTCPVVQVETNVVVPVKTASSKEEYSAATLRRKIEPMIAYFSEKKPIEEVVIGSRDIDVGVVSIPIDHIDALLDSMGVVRSVPACTWIRGGERSAKTRLHSFADSFSQYSNDPAVPSGSKLSPYLHFGQISPVTIYHQIIESDAPGVPDFIEQLIVRRELAVNYVYYNTQYDQYEGLPVWAQKTLEVHSTDPRPYRYSADDLREAHTHDQYWNAAQRELVYLGTMDGYMRMYWGKKLLEWCASPQEAFSLALTMNNEYQLDGRDPNGYAGVAWCFGKHDRPWVERPIFGNVRYMNDRGLERKFAIDRYVQRIERTLHAQEVK